MSNTIIGPLIYPVGSRVIDQNIESLRLFVTELWRNRDFLVYIYPFDENEIGFDIIHLPGAKLWVDFYYINYENFQILHKLSQLSLCPVGWDCRIHWLIPYRRVRPPRNECPRYDTKQSDGEFIVMLKLWGMWSAPLLPSLPCTLWPGVVAPDRVLSMGQMEQNCIDWDGIVLTFTLRI